LDNLKGCDRGVADGAVEHPIDDEHDDDPHHDERQTDEQCRNEDDHGCFSIHRLVFNLFPIR